MCVVVATQCMHGSVSLAACCAFVRPPLFCRRFLLFSEERKLIPQLLELLRSEALSALIPTVSPVPSNPAAAQNVQKQQKNTSIRDKNVDSTTASGWKPVKSVKSAFSETRDKLLPNGWSVPIKNTITEMSSSAPGICLVSNTEARKIVKELKGEHALAILAPSNITG